MTQIPSDDILESLHKSRIRESEKLKTVLELYNMEILQKKAALDYHILKTMVKRSIEQNLRMKNFEARNGNYETCAVVKNQGQNSVNKEVLEIVGNGNLTGSALKETIAVFRHDVNKRAKMTQPNPFPNSFMQQDERKTSRTRTARITSKELAPLHSVKNGILQNACSTSPRVVADLGKSALMRIARLMNSLAKGPERMVTKVQWLC